MLPATAFAAPKLFVLDTNVILHDSNCIENFEEHDIAIPITVIEELDRFKKGHAKLNVQFAARCDEAVCTPDQLRKGGPSWSVGELLTE